jgi:hypothetical protein
MGYAGFSDKEFSRALFAGLARRADMENCGFSMYKSVAEGLSVFSIRSQAALESKLNQNVVGREANISAPNICTA